MRIQARKVRSLAKVKRGSGSLPTAYTRRGHRRSGRRRSDSGDPLTGLMVAAIAAG